MGWAPTVLQDICWDVCDWWGGLLRYCKTFAGMCVIGGVGSYGIGMCVIGGVGSYGIAS